MKALVKTTNILGLEVSAELGERLKQAYQDKQLDKLATSVDARQAHVEKIASLKKRFEELSNGTAVAENIEALNPKLREALAARVMQRHEKELLDLLEQIAREEKAIKKIDDNFEGIAELL